MPAPLQYTLDFLHDLQQNNNREWFNDHRREYDQARAAFEDFVAQVIDRFEAVDDLGGVTPAQAMYRINRDTRFSPDKTPYKTAMGALLGKDGRKSTGRAYYVQIKPGGGSVLAGGMYMVFPPQLETIRRALAEDPAPLRAVLESDSFKRYFGQMGGEQVKTAPKGYPKDHSAIDLLRYKQYLADHPFTDAEVVADDFVDKVIEAAHALKPFISYLFGLLEAEKIV